jgi:menaquinone-dependent protoporphyrinogen IX oxidase
MFYLLVFGLVVASVYYSRTGVTRAVSEFIVGWLAGRGLRVDVFELRALREYARPLHLNPRLIFDTIFRGPLSTAVMRVLSLTLTT